MKKQLMIVVLKLEFKGGNYEENSNITDYFNDD